jgi:putative DNA primase/helicase
MTNGMYEIAGKTFPREMVDVPLWLIFKLVDRGDGKFAKPPMSPISGKICDKTDEGKYTDFKRALVGIEQHKADGVGFVFLGGFMAIDLDNCFTDAGELTELAADIYDHFRATYVEYSPSGNGLHIFCQGEKPYERTRSEGIEVYTGHNFVTVTGDHVEGSGEKVLNMQAQIEWMFDKYLPKQDVPTITKFDLIEIDHGDKTPVEWLEIGLERDEKLKRLYNDTDHAVDESSADMSLLCKLAYWLNCDVEAIENAFFDSPWCHSKDPKHLAKVDRRADYFETSLMKAISMTSSTAIENERKYKNIPDIKLRISENEHGDIIIPLDDYTDVGNAKSFADMYSQTLAYTKEWGWCSYNGLNWEFGQNHQAYQCAVEFGETVMYIAKQVSSFYHEKCNEEGVKPSSTEGKEIMAPALSLMKHANRTQSANGIRALLEVAEGMMLVPSSAFDSHPWELNTPNVVIDLRTGETYPPAWNHYNSMLTSLTYDANAESSGMWNSFLDTIFCGDQALIDYVQVVMGATCVGKVYEESLVIANGSGSNGKSTLFGILGGVLGDYCVNINPDILMAKVSYEQQISLAQIKGKRLVIGQETESGQQLSTASLKRMVSTDAMVGRVLHQGYIEFTPTHSTVLATNHLPKVKDNDEGTWRRLIVIPFNAVITGEDVITNFQDVLMAEDGPYILKWLVDGARKFYENGCTYPRKPAAVLFASNNYRDGQRDSVELFAEECLQFVDKVRYPNRYSLPSDVYQRYLDWCEDNGLKMPLTKTGLLKALGEFGVESAKKNVNGNSMRVWTNMLLKNKDGTDQMLVEF